MFLEFVPDPYELDDFVRMTACFERIATVAAAPVVAGLATQMAPPLTGVRGLDRYAQLETKSIERVVCLLRALPEVRRIEQANIVIGAVTYAGYRVELEVV